VASANEASAGVQSLVALSQDDSWACQLSLKEVVEAEAALASLAAGLRKRLRDYLPSV
jgi:hypothetical protein